MKELYEKLARLNADARKVIDAADVRAGGKGKGQLTAEESAQVDKLYAEYDQVKTEIEACEKAENLRKRADDNDSYLNDSAGRRTAPNASGRKVDDVATVEVRGNRIELRPGTQGHAISTSEYQAAFSNYLTNGINAGLQTAVNTQGGYLAPVQLAANLIQFLDDSVFMRSLATVLPPLTNGVSLGIPTLETDPGDADWTAEVPASDISEDTSMAFGKRELAPQLLTKYVKVSNKLIRAAAISIESFVTQRLGYKFGITEEKGFLTGTGASQPLGVFVASVNGISTSRDVTCASQTAFTADELIDVVYNLKPQYLKNATWVCHRDFVKRARKLKDGQGNYLFTEMTMSMPEMICGRPVVTSEYAPNTFTTGKYIAILGDFRTGYTIVDSLQLEVQRLTELAALKNQVGFLGRKETDGMPVIAEAFSRMILA